MSKRPLLSGETKASTVSIQGCIQDPLNVFINAVQTEARTRSWLVNAHREGVEFGGAGGGWTEGDVQERKGPHIHVTGGNRKYWAIFNSHMYLFTLVPVLPSFRSFKCNFLSSVIGESSLSSTSQPAKERWHCHTELPVKTRHRRNELLLLLLLTKRGTTSGVVRRRGHTPLHKASGQRNGAIVLQLRASRDRSGALLISLRGSLQRETESSAASCSTERLAQGVSNWGACFSHNWDIYVTNRCSDVLMGTFIR